MMTITTPTAQTASPASATQKTVAGTSCSNATRITASAGITSTVRFVRELVKSQLRAKSSV